VIGEERFLSYNKTSIMHRTFQAANVDYQFVNVSESPRSMIARYFSYIAAYVRLAMELPKSTGNTICWLSEFKFSIPHAIAASIIAKLKGMQLVGGPHTLSADSVFLTNAEFHTNRPSWKQRIKVRLYGLRDRIALSQFDAVQSYTPQYLDRVCALISSQRKS